MLHKHVAVGILSLILVGVGNAQGAAFSPETGANYSLAQLKQLARNAHDPEQYKTLAGYYGERQKHYLQQAAEEKKEWERRSQNVMGVLAKYPRPVDSARNLYEYYMYEASEAGNREVQYSRMASPHALMNGE
jgi:hypothetical protein